MRRLPLAVLALLLLSGCTAGGEAELSEAEKAARSLDVEATETTGVIKGIVVDLTITPIAGVTVSLNGQNVSTTTNDLGAFAFADLEPGTYFLTTSHENYTSVQQSVDVVAGEQDPSPVRIQVAAILRADPRVDAYTATIFVDSSIVVLGTGYTLGGVTTESYYWFEVPIEPNATVAQTEVRWEAGTPLAENAAISGGTYAGNDRVQTSGQQGPTPMVFRANATEGEDTADNVYYQVFATDSAGLPGGMITNQRFDCFIHAFYNFMPDADWQYGRDGEYPL